MPFASTVTASAFVSQTKSIVVRTPFVPNVVSTVPFELNMNNAGSFELPLSVSTTTLPLGITANEKPSHASTVVFEA